MNVSKAPAGGLASHVNGQWYEGGEFMPVHGVFCGKAGSKRSVKWNKAKASNRAKDLGGDKLFEITEWQSNCFVIVGYALASSHKEAQDAFASPKCRRYARQV